MGQLILSFLAASIILLTLNGPFASASSTIYAQLINLNSLQGGGYNLQASWTGGVPDYSVTLLSGSSQPCTTIVYQFDSSNPQYYHDLDSGGIFQFFSVYPSGPTYYCIELQDSAGDTGYASYHYVPSGGSLPTSTTSISTTTVNYTSIPTAHYPLNINDTGIGAASPATAYYLSGTKVTINATVKQGSPWCITLSGTGPGSFSGTLLPPVSNFTVTMYGPINETANFTQCGTIIPPITASISTSPTPQTNSTGQFLITGNWSGGVPPYAITLTSGSSPFCGNDKTVVTSNSSTLYNSFKALIAQPKPTYYCLNVSDSNYGTVLLPSAFVSLATQAAQVESTTTTTVSPQTACTPPHCGGHYTISTTAFPTVSTSSATTTWYTSTTTTTIPSRLPNNPPPGIIASIIAFLGHLVGLA